MLKKKAVYSFLLMLVFPVYCLGDPIPPNPADPDQEAQDICRLYCQGQDPALRICLANQQTELYAETGLSYGILPDDTVSDVADLYGVSDQLASDSMYAAGGSGSSCGGGN